MAGRLGQRLLVGALTSFVCAATFAGTALAQDGSTNGDAKAAPAKDDAARVLELVKTANDEFDRGEYQDALNLYREAYALYPESVLLYRIGVAEEKLGNTRPAIEAYQTYIDAAAEGDATANKLKERVAELKATLPGTLVVTSTPAGAQIFVGTADGAALGTTPATIEVPAGAQTLVARLEGFRLTRQDVSVTAGEESAVAFTLQPLATGEKAEPEVFLAEPATTTDSSSGSLALWGYVAAGTGVALIGTGALFEVLSQNKADEVNAFDKRAPGATREELQGLKDDSQSFYNTAVASFVTGGVLAGLGVGLIVYDAMSSDEAVANIRLEVSPTSGGGQVSLSGHF